jgi:hypothetical protein
MGNLQLMKFIDVDLADPFFTTLFSPPLSLNRDQNSKNIKEILYPC